jgi:hypothetical protein
LTSPLARARVARLYPIFLTFVLLPAFALPESARAEKIIAKGDDWEVYTDGRVAGFLSWTFGQGPPQNTYGVNPSGNITTIHDIKGGGFGAYLEGQQPVRDPSLPPDQTTVMTQGRINAMRVRSGFIGNQLGLGVRGKVTPWTSVTGYIQIWAFVESEARQKNRPNYADVRQGYLKLEGLWGSLLAGRTRALFSRGATDINTLYAHRFGVGWPGGIDTNGPTLGMIGFGVMGSGFSAGVIYGTPVLQGFQLNVGLFDPIQLQNAQWTRTKSVRPEAELTYEQKFGDLGKIVLFGNGVYQKVYKSGYCVAGSQENPGPCDETAYGLGYGGRFEFGPARLGMAGHYGKGLGLNYALEASDATADTYNNLRKNDGYYVQTQLVLGKVDTFAGWGIDRVFLTAQDNERVLDPRRPVDPNWTDEDKQREIAQYGVIPHSVIKYQMGINCGIVYHVTPNLHLDVEYFRAQAKWFLGESQVVHVASSGLTFNW